MKRRVYCKIKKYFLYIPFVGVRGSKGIDLLCLWIPEGGKTQEVSYETCTNGKNFQREGAVNPHS